MARTRTNPPEPVVVHGKHQLADADALNRPVRLLLRLSPADARWHLHGDLHMPRKGRRVRDAYHYSADSPEPLRALVRRYVAPLYTALAREVADLGAGLVAEAILV